MEVGDDNFATEIEGHAGLAVVDFWATWCAPCRMIGPIVEQLAGEYAGRAKVAKLDVDNNQRTAARFNVRSIPTTTTYMPQLPIVISARFTARRSSG